MKKFILFLLCLSTVGFAKGPVRHRVPMSLPDQMVAQVASQSMMKEMLAIVEQAEVSAEDVIRLSYADNLISAAKGFLGARYRRGSRGPRAFDCSGFTSYVFSKLGISLKRSSQEQHTQGTFVADIRDLQPGDLVFFGHGGSNKRVNHVGIVTEVSPEEGTFNFIHASTSRGVRIDSSADAYWTRRYVNGRRIL